MQWEVCLPTFGKFPRIIIKPIWVLPWLSLYSIKVSMHGSSIWITHAAMPISMMPWRNARFQMWMNAVARTSAAQMKFAWIQKVPIPVTVLLVMKCKTWPVQVTICLFSCPCCYHRSYSDLKLRNALNHVPGLIRSENIEEQSGWSTSMLTEHCYQVH